MVKPFLAGLLISVVVSAAPDLPDRSYYVYVCAESEDEVAVVRYGPDGLDVVRTISVGRIPATIEGPHGIGFDPDGRHWYVSMSHGFPFGTLHRYETETDKWLGDIEVGMYPSTLAVSSTTGFLYVANFDLHGPLETGTVSVIETEAMTEIARIKSGLRPHGARLSQDGTNLYSVNVMGAEVVEIDALTFGLTRRLFLGSGVQPTWVTTPTITGRLFVTGNNVDRIFEVDIARWEIVRTFETGPGPYNIDLTPDESTLVVTYKNGASVGFWDLHSGQERMRVATTRTIPHGVVLTPDGKYAFITLEGVGSEPGTVEVYHVASAKRVGTVDVGKQAGGIAFWRMF